MYRRLCARKVNADDGHYNKFEGQLIVVDLAEIDGKNETFEGAKWLETGLSAPVSCCLHVFFPSRDHEMRTWGRRGRCGTVSPSVSTWNGPRIARRMGDLPRSPTLGPLHRF